MKAFIILSLTLAAAPLMAQQQKTQDVSGSDVVAAQETAMDLQQDWRKDVPCGANGPNPSLVKLGPPMSVAKPECSEAHCVRLDAHTQVCGCDNGARIDLTGLESFELILERDGGVLNRWEWKTTGAGGVNTEWFMVLKGDLDGDGKAEVVIPSLLGSSMGMCISYWQIAILDGRDLTRPPVSLEIEDFSEQDNFLRSSTNGQCEILRTTWQSTRGSGLYLIGEWFRYSEGHLTPDTTRPILARRYLFSFERERNRAARAFKFKWFLDRRTEIEPTYPLDLSGLTATGERESGTITGMADHTVELTTGLGKIIRYHFANPDLSPAETTYSLLAERDSGRPYPFGYTPVVGRRATVVEYRDSAGEKIRIVWLER